MFKHTMITVALCSDVGWAPSNAIILWISPPSYLFLLSSSYTPNIYLKDDDHFIHWHSQSPSFTCILCLQPLISSSYCAPIHMRDEYQVVSLLSDGRKGLRGSQVVTISEVGRADDTSNPVCFWSFSRLHVYLLGPAPTGQGLSHSIQLLEVLPY